MEIWFNPACSKCRTAATALDDAGAEYGIRRYLDDPPTPAELDAVLTALGLQPWDIARLTEPVAKELDLANRPLDRQAWVEVMCAHPILIQRPIVVLDDGSARVVRDADTLGEVVAQTKP